MEERDAAAALMCVRHLMRGCEDEEVGVMLAPLLDELQHRVRRSTVWALMEVEPLDETDRELMGATHN